MSILTGMDIRPTTVLVGLPDRSGRVMRLRSSTQGTALRDEPGIVPTMFSLGHLSAWLSVDYEEVESEFPYVIIDNPPEALLERLIVSTTIGTSLIDMTGWGVALGQDLLFPSILSPAPLSLDTPRGSTDDASTDETPLRPEHALIVDWIRQATNLSRSRVATLLGISRQTLSHWEHGASIEDRHLRRLLLVQEILQRAQRQHPLPAQLRAWLDTPRGLRGETPSRLLAAEEFDRARLWAMVTASQGVVRSPGWVGQPVPPRFADWREPVSAALEQATLHEEWAGALPSQDVEEGSLPTNAPPRAERHD